MKQGELERSLTTLNELTQQGADSVEILELKARLLSTKGYGDEARKIYRSLIERRQAEPPSVTGPYYFELGILDFEEKKMEEAAQSLQASVDRKYNLHSAHYLLGAIRYEQNDLERARAHFHTVLRSPSGPWQLQARTYVAIIEKRHGNAQLAMRHQQRASQLAAQSLNDGNNQGSGRIDSQTAALFQRAVETYLTGDFIGNVGLYGGYDSNPIFVSEDQTASSDERISALSAALRFGLGFAGPAASGYQWVPFYNGSLKYLSNPSAKSAQLFAHNLGVQVTRNASSLTNHGAQVSASGTLQTRKSDNGSILYAPYSLGMSLGPFARWEIWPQTVLGGSAYFHLDKNYVDDVVASEERRSGWKQGLFVFLARVDHQRWWNPSVFLNVTANQSSGENFRYAGADVGFSNPMHFSDRTTLISGITFLNRYFHSRVDGTRVDLEPSFSLVGIHEWNDHLTGLFQLGYSKNTTNMSRFRYSRFFGSLGVTYSF